MLEVQCLATKKYGVALKTYFSVEFVSCSLLSMDNKITAADPSIAHLAFNETYQ